MERDVTLEDIIGYLKSTNFYDKLMQQKGTEKEAEKFFGSLRKK